MNIFEKFKAEKDEKQWKVESGKLKGKFKDKFKDLRPYNQVGCANALRAFPFHFALSTFRLSNPRCLDCATTLLNITSLIFQ